jgi:hypothetical protein
MEGCGIDSKKGESKNPCASDRLRRDVHVPLPYRRTRGHRHDGNVAYHGYDVEIRLIQEIFVIIKRELNMKSLTRMQFLGMILSKNKSNERSD